MLPPSLALFVVLSQGSISQILEEDHHLMTCLHVGKATVAFQCVTLEFFILEDPALFCSIPETSWSSETRGLRGHFIFH